MYKKGRKKEGDTPTKNRTKYIEYDSILSFLPPPSPITEGLGTNKYIRRDFFQYVALGHTHTQLLCAFNHEKKEGNNNNNNNIKNVSIWIVM